MLRKLNLISWVPVVFYYSVQSNCNFNWPCLPLALTLAQMVLSSAAATDSTTDLVFDRRTVCRQIIHFGAFQNVATYLSYRIYRYGNISVRTRAVTMINYLAHLCIHQPIEVQTCTSSVNLIIYLVSRKTRHIMLEMSILTRDRSLTLQLNFFLLTNLSSSYTRYRDINAPSTTY